MNSALVALGVLICFWLGYRFYSRYLGSVIWGLDDSKPTPAVSQTDGVDYVPTAKPVLFGHHYASIAGAAPIVGPAIAIIWGWVPAVIWVVVGSIFLGAAHDFGALVISMRHRGQSVGQVTANVIGSGPRNLFLVVIFFLVWLVIAVFALVIANLFISYPSTVLPVNFQIVVALAIGYLVNRKGRSLFVPTLLAQIGLFVAMYFGALYPISLEPLFGDGQKMAWISMLLIYSFIASVLPVWALLQPRDYINSYQLFIGLGAMVLGLFIVQPTIVAPALNLSPQGAPFWLPFLFITIACGAVSGFHGLVSSGTTSKQVKAWSHSRPIGYGAMLGEGLLALLATLAVATGFESASAWHVHYGSWDGAKGLSASIEAFVMGSTQFLGGLGIPETFAGTMIGVLIISFAATSLDTAARIQRYVVAELGTNWKIPTLQNRYVASGIAIGSAFLLMMFKGGGTGGLVLWPLFGATNQMLAALTLIVVTVYLIKKGKPSRAYLFPAIFLSLVTFIALLSNIKSFYQGEKYLLLVMALVLLVVQMAISCSAFPLLRKKI